MDFEIGHHVVIECWDGAKFEGVLEDFDAERDYFTLRTRRGSLGFAFGSVRVMDAA